MRRSGWMQLNDQGENDEEIVTTFGQLVPLLLTLLTVFALIGMVGGMFFYNLSFLFLILNYLDKFSEHRHRNDKPKEPQLDLESPVENSPSSSETLEEKKDKTAVHVASLPPTPILEVDEIQFETPAPDSPNDGGGIVKEDTHAPSKSD